MGEGKCTQEQCGDYDTLKFNNCLVFEDLKDCGKLGLGGKYKADTVARGMANFLGTLVYPRVLSAL